MTAYRITRGFLKYVYLTCARLLGGLFFAYMQILKYTCRIQFTGKEYAGSRNVIFCIWHQSFAVWLVTFGNLERHAWLVNPKRKVKHIEVLLKLMGLKHICYGTSGYNGANALVKVIDYLKKGYTTTVAADGPGGPRHELKRGALLMSANTKIPVIPVRFKCSCYIPSPQWDRKMIPLPFSTITAEMGEPVYADANNSDAAKKQITAWLNFAV